MKVVYPKNIQKWFLAWLTFTIGPLSLSIIQLFVLAIGIAAGMGIFQAFNKSGGKVIGIFLAVVVVIIFIAIAFFKMSELSLIPFIAKLVRNNFFDSTKKYQINYQKSNSTEIKIKEAKSEEEKVSIEQKESSFNKESLKNIQDSGLL